MVPSSRRTQWSHCRWRSAWIFPSTRVPHWQHRPPLGCSPAPGLWTMGRRSVAPSAAAAAAECCSRAKCYRIAGHRRPHPPRHCSSMCTLILYICRIPEGFKMKMETLSLTYVRWSFSRPWRVQFCWAQSRVHSDWDVCPECDCRWHDPPLHLYRRQQLQRSGLKHLASRQLQQRFRALGYDCWLHWRMIDTDTCITITISYSISILRNALLLLLLHYKITEES